MTTTIGFVGPGIMGAPMIDNLLKAGYDVVAYGRSQRSRKRIEQTGATLARDLDEAARGHDVVITMLPDSPDVESVLTGENGLIGALSPGQTVIDMSTIKPETARTLHARLEDVGVAMLDAPVSGGEAGAVEGTLSIMVGGDEQVLARHRGVLEAMGSTITHVGPSGAGQLAKAANQLIVAANIEAVAEAIVLLEHYGADLPQTLDALAGGLAGSTVLNRKRANFLSGDHSPGFRIALHNKDLRIVRETAQDARLSLPSTATVTELMNAAEAQGMADLDHSALLCSLRRLNGKD